MSYITHEASYWNSTELAFEMKIDKNNKYYKRLQLQGEIRESQIKDFTRKKNERFSNWNFQNNYWNL